MILGSRGLTGISRAVWHVTAVEEDKSRRLFLPGKNNLSAQQQGRAFSIAGEPAAVCWEPEPVDMHADDAMVPESGGENVSAVDEACAWLKEQLTDGPRPGRDVKDSARRDGIASRTLDRAKAKLDVTAAPDGYRGPWVWTLPECANILPESPDCARENDWRNVESMDKSGALCGDDNGSRVRPDRMGGRVA